jgi:DNA-binding CsgD family transcriptional regulator
VLKPEVVDKIENYFAEGKDINEISKELNIKIDTIKKGIQQNRIKKNSSAISYKKST